MPEARHPFSDPVAKADTRHAAPGGVPLGITVAVLLFFALGACLMLLVRMPGAALLFLPVAVPVWFAVRWWVDGDDRKAEVVWGWLTGAGMTPCWQMFRVWGGSTVAPLADAPDDFGMNSDG